MRTLKIIEHMSLDGVIQHSTDENDFPYNEWGSPYRSPEGGDAMLAAFCHEVLRGTPLEEAAQAGHDAAALTVASPHTVRADLREALARSRARERIER